MGRGVEIKWEIGGGRGIVDFIPNMEAILKVIAMILL